MADWGFEAATVAAFVVIAVAVGLIRREPKWAIAMSTAGYVAFLGATYWAINISHSAWWPVAIGSLGMYLITTAYERTRARKAVAQH